MSDFDNNRLGLYVQMGKGPDLKFIAPRGFFGVGAGVSEGFLILSSQGTGGMIHSLGTVAAGAWISCQPAAFFRDGEDGDWEYSTDADFVNNTILVLKGADSRAAMEEAGEDAPELTADQRAWLETLMHNGPARPSAAMGRLSARECREEGWTEWVEVGKTQRITEAGQIVLAAAQAKDPK